MEEKKEIESEVKIEHEGDLFYKDDLDNDFFVICFDKIFEKKELVAYNVFELNSKRNFKNLAPAITETYKELFLNKNGTFNTENAIILYQILNVKSKLVTSDESVTLDKVIEYLDKICSAGNNSLLERIDKYVEENYSLELDEITAQTKAKKKKVNKELQFSDKHAKTLLKIAYLYRILIPVISVFFTYNKDSFASRVYEIGDPSSKEDLAFDEVNSKIFSHLFEKFAANANALRNKLYKLTYSRVAKTSYSDQRFWKKAKDLFITKENVSLEIYQKLLTNAIPKLYMDPNLNVISFFQSVINNQVDFLFKNKFRYQVITYGKEEDKYIEEDEDDGTEFEKIELSMLRKNEGEFLIRKESIERAFNNMENYLGVSISEEEITKFLSTLHRNEIQEKVISMATLKYFEDPEALKFLSFYQYGKLVLLCAKYLEKHHFIFIPKMLVAKCEKDKEKVGISGKSIKPKIFESKKYQELFSNKMKEFSGDLKKPIEGLIGSAYSSIFTDSEGNNIFDSWSKVEKVADEVIDLALLA